MILALAMVLDALLGEPRWLWSRCPHPAVLMGRAVKALDRSLNRGLDRKAKGVVALVVLVACAVVIGLLISTLGDIVIVLVTAILLAQRSLVEHLGWVADGLRRSLEEGRAQVAMIVSRDTSEMNSAAVARSAIESAAENLSDGVIAPVFWFLIGGLPGILVYKVVNTADSMIGYRTPEYADFGWASARCDDVLNLIPARVTALMMTGLGGLWKELPNIAADASRHRSPNAGWPEAAMARMLNIALAGPRVYDGEMRDLAWVNRNARRETDAVDIDGAVGILWKVWGLAFALAVLIAIF